MAAYNTIVVGTDGSDSSLAAVERAARVAADSAATLVIACAYYPAGKDKIDKAQDVLGAEAAGLRAVWLDRAGRGSTHPVTSVRGLDEVAAVLDRRFGPPRTDR